MPVALALHLLARMVIGGPLVVSRRKLSNAEIIDALGTLNASLDEPWQVADGALRKVFRFADFAAAFGFMTRAALIAAAMDHHPDWRNVYARVEVALSTHDAGGITALDFELARRIDGV
jgi:4a-hydroxytetrahydrobiopterin dehydratase